METRISPASKLHSPKPAKASRASAPRTASSPTRTARIPPIQTREIMKRGAASLSAAPRPRGRGARGAGDHEKTGSLHGLLAEEGRVAGSIAVLIPPGISREKREDLIETQLGDKLTEAAESLGVVLAARR